MQLGHKSKVDLSKFSCQSTVGNLSNCTYSYSKGSDFLEVGLTLNGDLIQTYSIQTRGLELSKNILTQIKSFDSIDKQLNKKIEGMQNETMKVDNSEVQVIRTYYGSKKNLNSTFVRVSLPLN